MPTPTSAPSPTKLDAPQTKSLSGGQWGVLVAAFLGWGFDGLEQGLFPLAARPALQDLLNSPPEADIARWTSYLLASFLAGAALGGLLFGWLGDRMGRVRTMAVTILAYSVFTGLGYFATSPLQLGILRFFSALGMGGEWALGVALVMECWPERFRPLLAGVIGAASNVGFLVIALLGAFYPVSPDSWRWIMLAGAAPALLAVLILGFLPESERWKESVKKVQTNPFKEIFTTRLIWPTLLATIFASVALIGTWAAISQFAINWADQLAQAGGQVNAYAKAYTQVCVAIGAILGCVVAPLVGGRIGRRPAYFLLCLASLVVSSYLFGRQDLIALAEGNASLAWMKPLLAPFHGFTEYGPPFLATCMVAGFFTAAFYGWFPLYLPELFPTRVRATGQGLAYNFGRVFALFGALYTGSLMSYFGNSYARACATITLVYLIGMVLIWLAPETKGKPLPE